MNNKNQSIKNYEKFLRDLGRVADSLEPDLSNKSEKFVKELTDAFVQKEACGNLGRLELWLLWKIESDFLFSGDFWLDVQYWIGSPWDEGSIKIFNQINKELNNWLIRLGYKPVNIPEREDCINMKYFKNMVDSINSSTISSDILKNWTKTLGDLIEIADYQENNFQVKFGRIGQLNDYIFWQENAHPIANSNEDKLRLTLEIQQAIKEYEEEGRRPPKKIFYGMQKKFGKGQDYLIKTYGVKSRLKLTDEQLVEFLVYLEKQER